MIFLKSTLAGVAALIIVALVIYALAIGVPRILELIPSREGGIGVYSAGPFPMWPLGVVAFLDLFWRLLLGLPASHAPSLRSLTMGRFRNIDGRPVNIGSCRLQLSNAELNTRNVHSATFASIPNCYAVRLSLCREFISDHLDRPPKRWPVYQVWLVVKELLAALAHG